MCCKYRALAKLIFIYFCSEINSKSIKMSCIIKAIFGTHCNYCSVMWKWETKLQSVGLGMNEWMSELLHITSSNPGLQDAHTYIMYSVIKKSQYTLRWYCKHQVYTHFLTTLYYRCDVMWFVFHINFINFSPGEWFFSNRNFLKFSSFNCKIIYGSICVLLLYFIVLYLLKNNLLFFKVSVDAITPFTQYEETPHIYNIVFYCIYWK